MKTGLAAKSIARCLRVMSAVWLTLTACQAVPATAIDRSSTPVAAQPGSATNRIAVIEAGGAIYTANPDGSDRVDVNTSGAAPNAALAWSPDGSRLAFSLVTDDSSCLITTGPRGENRVPVFSDQPALAPFYLYWSPDSRRVAFLTPSLQDRMALQVAQATQAESARIIARGQPNYFSWSPEGERLALHIGGLQGYVGTYALADESTRKRDADPALFQAPAWSPAGEAYLFARDGAPASDDLVLARGDEETVLARFDAGIAFAWSPDGARVAYSTLSRQGPHYSGLYALDADGGAPRRLVDESHEAFFWSPDGARIAYLTARTGSDVEGRAPQMPGSRAEGPAAPRIEQSATSITLVWNVVDVASGRTTALASFRPTGHFLAVVPFFDQYAQSITFWSPDSRYLLLAGRPLGRESAIYRIDTHAESERLARIGPGEFAVWSWQ
jgi:TolB protein